MGFFDDLGDAFTTVAGEVFSGVNTATRVVFDAHREILGELGINKDSFANQVLDQWQEQQRVALGTHVIYNLFCEHLRYMSSIRPHI